MSEEKEMSMEKSIIVIGSILLMLLTLACVVGYYSNIAGDNANRLCQEGGFDQVKSYQSNPFSATPHVVTCEFASRSQQIMVNR
jgi:hypothetical protein